MCRYLLVLCRMLSLVNPCALCWLPTCLRPVNSANVTNVPNSDSKRSRRGAKATTLKIMWKKLRCMTGNRLSRCTTRKDVSFWSHHNARKPPRHLPRALFVLLHMSFESCGKLREFSRPSTSMRNMRSTIGSTLGFLSSQMKLKNNILCVKSIFAGSSCPNSLSHGKGMVAT
jgi:hypothetical protein